ncbi:ArnT family glycosyltransferase [Bradymonas sediminis]|uniref:Glycosyltransferase RgtA/B/C/D-like domain-containing protein n=1 Tax=Bradymonas sediminis TaxID=1548548 RepID=A0A2Z4FQC8_9DELT|nr:glycosyltransferase family 39 protein [Bradymonas sediminis]AWV91130.1 hypothetical protein DN745_18075 [Bradymonas sediminis]TDP73687.1 dolichyl-phosphate-mannose-protein mannosyltransferase [Bradymonas sediminis]
MYQKSLALVFLWVLYGSVGFLSYGYDDEFFNMNLVEAADGALQLAALVNRVDVHPPGSYLLNWLVLKLTGDWSFVRLVGAIMTASSLWLVWKEIARSRPAFFAFVAIGLNPTLLLWGTGLRWYAYAVTIINLMIYLLLRPCERQRIFWGFFFFLSVALVYIGYIGLIIVPVLFLIALTARRQKWRDEWVTIAWTGAAAAALVLPQIIVFFRVHLQNSSAQFGGYLRSIFGLGFHLFAGQGSYPLTIAGGALIFGNAILLVVSMADIRATLKAPSAQLLLVGSVSLLLTRLTTKYRNLVTLSSAQGAWQSGAYSRIQTRWLRVTTFVLISLGNLWGVVNVASHQNTSKGTWNMPYDEILATIRQRAEHCNAATLITSDPGIAYYGEALVPTLIYLHRDAHWKSNAEAAEGCIIAIRTFRGSMSRQKAQAYSDFLLSQKARTTEVIDIGFDKNASFKRRFERDIPEYYAYIHVIEPR